ncbi:hypothetical protein BH23THE1_BH23THE1_29200 [soil metagenome]
MSESSNTLTSVNIPYINLNENDIKDKTLKRLFCEAKSAIVRLEIYELLSELCSHEIKHDPTKPGLIITDKVQKQYRYLYKIASAIAGKIRGRVTITLPDGHIVVDTCKQEGNTYENYIDDVISENHNTRICIFQAQYGDNGASYETKYSSTTYQREIYVAVRLGYSRNSIGTLRLSIPE